MDNILNLKFLLFVVIVIFIFSDRKKKYFDKINLENYRNFDVKSKYATVKSPNLYSLEFDTLEFIPTLYTNFKYSMEYKFGLELSKIFRIRNSISEGLSSNIFNRESNDKNLYLCSEIDYYNLMRSKNTNLKFICSLYFQHFLLFVRSEISKKISSWQDIMKYSNKSTVEEKNENIIIGIPHEKTNSYQDALQIFKSININFKDYQDNPSNKKYKILPNSNLVFLFDTEKNLFSRLKSNDENNKVDCIYLTTSTKHPYLNEYLNQSNIDVISTEDIPESYIKNAFGSNNITFKHHLKKDTFTNIVRKKNIYEEGIMKILNNSKEDKIIVSQNLKMRSTRVIMVASEHLHSNYIKYLLRNIYGSIDKLKSKLNKYLFIPEKQNYLISPLDPYEMSYCHQIGEYHSGAYEFYQEIKIISDSESLSDNYHLKRNNYF